MLMSFSSPACCGGSVSPRTTPPELMHAVDAVVAGLGVNGYELVMEVLARKLVGE
jgi:hypothetical protein